MSERHSTNLDELPRDKAGTIWKIWKINDRVLGHDPEFKINFNTDINK